MTDQSVARLDRGLPTVALNCVSIFARGKPFFVEML
jgi:hypothetical protein